MSTRRVKRAMGNAGTAAPSSNVAPDPTSSSSLHPPSDEETPRRYTMTASERIRLARRAATMQPLGTPDTSSQAASPTKRAEKSDSESDQEEDKPESEPAEGKKQYAHSAAARNPYMRYTTVELSTQEVAPHSSKNNIDVHLPREANAHLARAPQSEQVAFGQEIANLNNEIQSKYATGSPEYMEAFEDGVDAILEKRGWAADTGSIEDKQRHIIDLFLTWKELYSLWRAAATRMVALKAEIDRDERRQGKKAENSSPDDMSEESGESEEEPEPELKPVPKPKPKAKATNTPKTKPTPKSKPESKPEAKPKSAPKPTSKPAPKAKTPTKSAPKPAPKTKTPAPSKVTPSESGRSFSYGGEELIDDL